MSSNIHELIIIINVIDKSMISIEISINIMFFLFKANPISPIKKSNKIIVRAFYFSNEDF
jgi:hypothetical protein